MSNKKLTPMLQQYMEIKQNTNDALVFYRLGDFYELFFEDAIIASRVLDLVLTARAAGEDNKAPMCGVPHHAAKNYIQKLVSAGYKVAIVEQVEDPKVAKGIVKREVVEIVTPGTYIEMDDNTTREVASLTGDLIYATIVSCDVMSGTMRAIRVMNDSIEIIKTLQQFQVREIVVSLDFDTNLIDEISEKTDIYVSYEDSLYEHINHEDSAIDKGLKRLYSYLYTTHKRNLEHLNPVVVLNDQAYLKMDYNSMKNLEIIDHQHQQELSLYHYMNKTKSKMGSRLLKEFIMQPLVSQEAIQKRHEIIEYYIHNYNVADQVTKSLEATHDIHRIVARLATNKHNPQDFVRLNNSLQQFYQLQQILIDAPIEGLDVDPLIELQKKIDQTILEDAPVTFKDGRTFKEGVSDELDELLELSRNGKKWLLEYESEQRALTEIKNLKIGYTRAFGYYIEISKGQTNNVREEFGYIRKQTLTNAERYISEELQNYEVKISQAQERIGTLELKLFNELTTYVNQFSRAIHKVGDVVAYIDVMLALSEISLLPGYTKPVLVDEKMLEIVDGKHPVLAETLRAHQYIASDCKMNDDRSTLILTGPNMGGKSTYMRMVALNIIMAQMGCYVPCKSMTFSIVDQIFTRMGASDDILLGQSTFMIEMLEAQTALSRATDRSFIVFDEIGRGTSTYDGMALAQAIIEYIHNTIKARTIFSTHYHELVTLESMYSGMKNIRVMVHEENNEVTFLYKIEDGKADRSYGINVARLAHLPASIINRAQENLEILELNKSNINIDRKIIHIEHDTKSSVEIRNILNQTQTDNITPLDALLLVKTLKEILEADYDKD